MYIGGEEGCGLDRIQIGTVQLSNVDFGRSTLLASEKKAKSANANVKIGPSRPPASKSASVIQGEAEFHTALRGACTHCSGAARTIMTSCAAVLTRGKHIHVPNGTVSGVPGSWFIFYDVPRTFCDTAHCGRMCSVAFSIPPTNVGVSLTVSE